MITLTTPEQINTVLGGNVPSGYDRVVLSPITLYPVERRIVAVLRLTSSTDAQSASNPVVGSVVIDLIAATVLVIVEQTKHRKLVSLSGPQVTTVQNIINAAQNSLESGLVSIGAVAGSQSAGA